jgi:molybdopterin-guanine dinucleotide biosynthesis protein B
VLKTSIKLINFIGFSGSGKTSSIVSLINYLTKITAFKIFVLKNIHHHTIDTKGKDTYRFSEAGADGVIARSNKATTFFVNNALNLNDIIKWLEEAPITPDIIITEGFRELKNDKILCVSRQEAIEEQFDNTIKVISGKIASESGRSEKSYKGIPIINALEQPEEIIKILLPDIL